MDKTTAVQQRTERIQELIARLESSADPETLAVARDLVENLMELYGAGLDRLTSLIAGRGERRPDILECAGPR